VLVKLLADFDRDRFAGNTAAVLLILNQLEEKLLPSWLAEQVRHLLAWLQRLNALSLPTLGFLSPFSGECLVFLVMLT